MLTSSIACIVFANLEFLSESISFLGLDLGISQINLVTATRVFAMVAFAVFIFHALSETISLLSDRIEKRNEKLRNEDQQEVGRAVAEFENCGGQPEYEPEPWDEWFHEREFKRKKTMEWISFWEAAFKSVAKVIAQYLLVIAVSMTAIIDPFAVGRALEAANQREFFNPMESRPPLEDASEEET